MLELMFWWGIFGVLAYQFTILRCMKISRCKVRRRDVIISLPFGPVVWVALLMSTIIIKCKIAGGRSMKDWSIWRDVNKELPDDGEEVIVNIYSGGRNYVQTLSYRDGGFMELWYSYEGTEWLPLHDDDVVTHWIPMPEPHLFTPEEKL